MFNITEIEPEMATAEYIHPEDNNPFGTTNDPFNSEINSTLNISWLTNEPETADMYSSYPRGLLRFAAICVIAFAVFGVLGNLISILAFSKCNRFRNATTAFIINLGFADLLFCSITMPLSAVQLLKGSRDLGEGLCKLFPILLYSNTYVSLFSVVAITVNRYILVVHPRIYPSVYGKRNTVIMIVVIWLIPFLFLMLPLLEIWGSLGYDASNLMCTLLKLNNKSPRAFFYIIGFGLPFITFPICYTRIFFAVRKASKRAVRQSEIPSTSTPHRDKKELRVLRVMLVMLILYSVCYFPSFYMNTFLKKPYPKYLFIAAYLGVYVTNIMNPVTYAVMSKEYRRAYKELFSRLKVKCQTEACG